MTTDASPRAEPRAIGLRARSLLKAALRLALDHVERSLPPPAQRSRLATIALIVAQLASVALFVAAWKQSGAVIAAAPAPPPVQPPTATTRFGLTEEQRRAMFRELAAAEQAERARAIAQNTWGGHAWSREDDLGYVLRDRARAVGQRYGLSLTHAYLVFDEGVRNRWPGPDGQPLSATVTPLSLRTE
ncbi:MAG: hypothetical protein U0269_03470 [Polyangiales bacterium]